MPKSGTSESVGAPGRPSSRGHPAQDRISHPRNTRRERSALRDRANAGLQSRRATSAYLDRSVQYSKSLCRRQSGRCYQKPGCPRIPRQLFRQNTSLAEERAAQTKGPTASSGHRSPPESSPSSRRIHQPRLQMPNRRRPSSRPRRPCRRTRSRFPRSPIRWLIPPFPHRPSRRFLRTRTRRPSHCREHPRRCFSVHLRQATRLAKAVAI
jgi:hypothetical protein